MEKLSAELVLQHVTAALVEDLNNSLDYTSELIPPDKRITAAITNNEEMVLCGIDIVNAVFLQIDPSILVTWNYAEGDFVSAHSTLCNISGNAQKVMRAERTALNFLQTLSATASITQQFVAKVQTTSVKIMDTRKTIPGLRYLQKYAVRIGGGFNQRFGLYDGVLIKENHIMACGGIKQALQAAHAITPAKIPIQIEVETFDELVEALEHKAALILLDNMSISQIKSCVEFNSKRAVLEVSGNINLDNVLAYAKTGVDRISIGGLTKNIKAIDLSLRVLP